MNSATPSSVKFRTVEISDPRWERDGLRQVTVKSPALKQRVDMSVFVCPGAAEQTDVPLVILLHGVYGSHWAWALKGGAHETAAKLARQGEIPPMVLAMPSDGLWGDGSGYVPHRTQNYERWIVDEVPAAAALAAPCLSENSPTFIAGLSMGGFGALRLAGKYPGRFCGASAHSAATHLDQLFEAVEETPEQFGVSAENASVLDVLIRNRAELPPFRFDCGTEDWLLDANRTLHEALLAEGITHGYQEHPGAHDWPYWERYLGDTLRFFGGLLCP